MNCEMAKMLISEYIDGRLDPERESELVSHIKTCPHCAEELRRYRKLVKLLQDTPEADPPPELLPGAVRRAREELRQEKGPITVRRIVAIAAAVVVTLGIGWYLVNNPNMPMTDKAAPKAAPAPMAAASNAAPATPEIMMDEAQSENFKAAGSVAEAPAPSAAPAASASAPASGESGKGSSAASESPVASEEAPQDGLTGTTPLGKGPGIPIQVPPEMAKEFRDDLMLFVLKYGLARDDTQPSGVESFEITEIAKADFLALLEKYGLAKDFDENNQEFPIKVSFVFSKS